MLPVAGAMPRQSCLLLAWAADFLGEAKEAEMFILVIKVNGCFCSQCIFKYEVTEITFVF